MESRKTELVDTENRLVVFRGASGCRDGGHERGEGEQEVQTSSCKINQSWGCNEQHGECSQ